MRTTQTHATIAKKQFAWPLSRLEDLKERGSYFEVDLAKNFGEFGLYRVVLYTPKFEGGEPEPMMIGDPKSTLQLAKSEADRYAQFFGGLPVRITEDAQKFAPSEQDVKADERHLMQAIFGSSMDEEL